MPLINDHVDRCIECGFCEVNCVSSGFTLSSRQRIIVQREIKRLRATGQDPERLARLERQYRYYGEQTCAADGLCSTSCPMKINVGDLTHDLRGAKHGPGTMAHGVGAFCADHFAGVKAGVRSLLYVADAAHTVLGDKGVTAMGKALHCIGLPLWTPALPKPRRGAGTKHTASSATRVGNGVDDSKKVVYFPSCLNQTMGRAQGVEHDLVDTVVSFLQRAGWEVIFPKNMKSLCCGMIWESKGMPDVANRKLWDLEAELFEASEGGLWPIVCDQSPCLHRMRTLMKPIKPMELMEFIHDHVADSLNFRPVDEPVMLHLTCSTRLMGIDGKVLDLAQRCSTHVVVPDGVGCCGFAGDKGFSQPELNAYALRHLRQAVKESGARRGFSNSRTCEIGLTTHSGIPYQSLVYLIDEVTR